MKQWLFWLTRRFFLIGPVTELLFSWLWPLPLYLGSVVGKEEVPGYGEVTLYGWPGPESWLFWTLLWGGICLVLDQVFYRTGLYERVPKKKVFCAFLFLGTGLLSLLSIDWARTETGRPAILMMKILAAAFVLLLWFSWALYPQEGDKREFPAGQRKVYCLKYGFTTTDLELFQKIRKVCRPLMGLAALVWLYELLFFFFAGYTLGQWFLLRLSIFVGLYLLVLGRWSYGEETKKQPGFPKQ